jgi:lactate dehydrogenase-like 2-hydroxyacid dehydrogenase
MKVAVFSTTSYDQDFFQKFNNSKKNQLIYFALHLNKETVNLSLDFEAVCVFVNDKIDDITAQKLSQNGVKLIVIRFNTSRGAVINTKDVSKALKSGKLGYLGIDVYEQEENKFFRYFSESIDKDDIIASLVSFPNVLITAHQGFFTNEALEQITKITLKNIEDFEKVIT